MPEDTPETVICTFRVIAEREAAFRALLERHWPTLHRLGLTTDEPARTYRGYDGKGPFYVEIFEWRDARAAGAAHEHPEVMAVWEPMDPLCEAREGRPAMEFPHVERVAPGA